MPENDLPIRVQLRGVANALLALFALASIVRTALDYNIYTEVFQLSAGQMQLLYWLFALLAAETLYTFVMEGRDGRR